MECHIDSVAYLLGLLGAGSMLWFMNNFLTTNMNNSLATKVAHLEEALETAIREIESLRPASTSDEEHTD